MNLTFPHIIFNVVLRGTLVMCEMFLFVAYMITIIFVSRKGVPVIWYCQCKSISVYNKKCIGAVHYVCTRRRIRV